MRTTLPAHGGHDHAVDIDATFEFLNTRELEGGEPVDHLATLDDALHWFVEHGLVHPEAASGAAGDVDRVRAVRDALREVADAVVEERSPAAAALTTVNDALRRRSTLELVPAADGVGIGHRHVGDPVDDALARLADPLVAELAAGRPDRVRVCANERCRWVFYDASRAGRRRWCDMAVCGNRAKAARHRARRREAAGA